MHPLNGSTTNNTGFSQSLWMEEELPAFPALTGDDKADVCIVGGGIAGLSCAYTLAKEGKSVILIDQGKIGGGETARTTAHLSWALNDRYYELERILSEEGLRYAKESHAKAIDQIEKIIIDEKIDCHFARVDGYLFLAEGDSLDVLEKELHITQKLGMGVEMIENGLLGPSLRFPNQAQMHIFKYLKGLIAAIIRYGGKLYSQTKALVIEEGQVKTNGGKITASSIIVATNTPINNRVMVHTKQAPYRTYVIAAKGSIPKALYWDTQDPYHYVRTEGDWLIIGGEDHKTGQEMKPDTRFANLEAWARKRFSFDRVEWKWSGQVFNTVDALGFIGKNPWDKSIYIATGDSGNGMTHGTIAGILIPDLIAGRTNSWTDLYDPARKSVLAAPVYVEENLNTLAQYGDWFSVGEKEFIKDLLPNEGIVLREGVKKIAVYKDPDGKLHVNSAFCPHLGGCVHWNSCEKSWDCPCHGSRFDGSGKVIMGPANGDLTASSKE